ncbi:MAG: hypothetical protein WCA37_13350 [Terracidiphilus sp.]
MQVQGSVVAGSHGVVQQPRLVRAAHEFEAQMMKELLKPLSASAGLDGESEDAGSEGALGEFATEALGAAVSQQGGLGIANSILQHFNVSGTSSPRQGLSDVHSRFSGSPGMDD